MSHPSIPTAVPEFDPLILAASTWLACGLVLMGLTPLPLHDATLGWSPAFWLLIAPCVLLVARRYAATPFRFASIRLSSSRMMR